MRAPLHLDWVGNCIGAHAVSSAPRRERPRQFPSGALT